MKNGLLALFILLLAPVILYAHGEMKHEELGRNILKAEKKGIKVKGWIDNIEKTIQEAAKDLDLQVVADKEDPLPNHRVTFWIGKS
ncbi:MAG: hypothetical protein U1C55_09825, partial [Smithellaceae bacterium]|nr:hypothetical protein [Smithellaceae bacterium]